MSIAELLQPISRIWHSELLPRYQQLAPREQWVLKFAATFLPVMILVFGIYMPLQDKLEALGVQVAKLEGQRSEAQMLADHLQQSGGASRPSESGLTIVERVASSTNVRKSITRIKPQPALNGARSLMVHFSEVPYVDALRFIAELGASGLSVTRAKLRATETPGVVNIELIVLE